MNKFIRLKKCTVPQNVVLLHNVVPGTSLSILSINIEAIIKMVNLTNVNIIKLNQF